MDGTKPQFLQTPQGLVLQLPLSAFLNNVLPPLRHDLHPSKVLATLAATNTKSASHRPISSRGRWRGFAKDPAKMKGPAKRVFLALENVLQSIIKATGLEDTPAPFRCNSREDSLPDSFLYCGRGRLWSEVLALGELKKTATTLDIYDNAKKVMSSIARCMHRDPRRRFIFAFTIENMNMRLWYCDRSQTAVSVSFNFITEHEPFVHFLLSLMYARESELGLDPSITSISEGGQLDITVHSEDGGTRSYRTLGLLAEREADSPHGKGTRVWKAVQVVDGRETGDHIVLKDAWVAAEQPPEGTTFSRLLRACQSTDQSRHIADSLVTVEAHGDVVTDGVLDCTPIISGTDPYKPPETRAGLLRIIERNKTSYPVASCPLLSLRNTSCLVHYRIVYKEVCRPLSGERSLTIVFRALAQIALTLKSLHAAGWVHRDVSDGNILLQDGTARLTDLEYAKEYGHGSEYRLGTVAFMPVEVECQAYQFNSHTARRLVTDPMELDPPSPFSDDFDRQPVEPVVVEEPFRYNAVHDLESLWWIALYFIFKLDVVRGPPQVVEPSLSSEKQRVLAYQLFEHHQAEHVRARVFSGGERNFLEVRYILPRIWVPLGTQMEHLRHELFARYCDIEQDCMAIDTHCADGLHELFHATFTVFVEKIQHHNFIVRPFSVGDAYNNMEEDAGPQTPEPVPIPEPQLSAKRGCPDASVSEPVAKRAKTQDRGGAPRSRPYLPRKAKSRRSP